MTFKGLFNLNCAVISAMIPSRVRNNTADLCCRLDNLYSASSFVIHSYLENWIWDQIEVQNGSLSFLSLMKVMLLPSVGQLMLLCLHSFS